MQTTFSGQKNSGGISVNTASLCVDSDLGYIIISCHPVGYNEAGLV